MELRVLRYFLAVAREGTVSGAADFLHLSQPSLSRQLMGLEKELGKTLFLRGSQRIVLTEEGMLLRRRAEEILGLVEKTEGGQIFPLRLEDNETARAFETMLPLTLEMADLNANEKYHNLRSPLPSSPEGVGTIRAGDVMLFGDDCIVLFYKSFSTPYRYTRIGRIEDASTLEDAVGRGSVTVSFDR